MTNLRELAHVLTSMGIKNASFDVDFDILMMHKREAIDALIMICESKSNVHISPGFTIQIGWVNLYFYCSKVSYKTQRLADSILIDSIKLKTIKNKKP